MELASATIHMGMFVHSAQKVPFSYYCEMSDDEVLFPVSQRRERKEELNSWAPARATVVLCTLWLPPPGCSLGILVVAAQSQGFYSLASPLSSIPTCCPPVLPPSPCSRWLGLVEQQKGIFFFCFDF